MILPGNGLCVGGVVDRDRIRADQGVGKIAIAFGVGGHGGDGIAGAAGAVAGVIEIDVGAFPIDQLGDAQGPPILKPKFSRADEGLAMLWPLSEKGAAFSAEFCTVEKTDP